jgi:predicted ThiF/HesA family dinucleotide-utilizing enzyme
MSKPLTYRIAQELKNNGFSAIPTEGVYIDGSGPVDADEADSMHGPGHYFDIEGSIDGHRFTAFVVVELDSYDGDDHL